MELLPLHITERNEEGRRAANLFSFSRLTDGPHRCKIEVWSGTMGAPDTLLATALLFPGSTVATFNEVDQLITLMVPVDGQIVVGGTVGFGKLVDSYGREFGKMTTSGVGGSGELELVNINLVSGEFFRVLSGTLQG